MLGTGKFLPSAVWLGTSALALLISGGYVNQVGSWCSEACSWASLIQFQERSAKGQSSLLGATKHTNSPRTRRKWLRQGGLLYRALERGAGPLAGSSER